MEVKMKGKRAEAEKLFAEGFNPDSPEVVELGLKRDTVKRYFRDYNANTKAPEAEAGFTVEITAPAGTELGDLAPRQLFEYGGEEYRVNQIFPDKIHVLLVEDAPTGGYKIEKRGRYLPKDTKVIPK
jgi:hypothetical protein